MVKGKGGEGSSIYGMRLRRDRCPGHGMKDRREPGPYLPQSRFSHPSRVLSGGLCGGGKEDGRRILALPPLPPSLPRHRSPLLAEKHFPFQDSPIFFVLYFCVLRTSSGVHLIRTPPMSKTTFSISILLSAVAYALTAAKALPFSSFDSHHYQYKENSYYKKND